MDTDRETNRKPLLKMKILFKTVYSHDNGAFHLHTLKFAVDT